LPWYWKILGVLVLVVVGLVAILWGVINVGVRPASQPSQKQLQALDDLKEKERAEQLTEHDRVVAELKEEVEGHRQTGAKQEAELQQIESQATQDAESLGNSEMSIDELDAWRRKKGV